MSIKNIISFFLLILFSQLFLNNISTNSQVSNSSIPLNTNNTEGKKVIDSKKSFNMTIDEMDTMMLCTVIVQESTKNYEKKFNEIHKKLNVSINMIREKVSTDIFEKCTKNINIKNVNYYIKNLTFLNNFKWEKNFEEFTKIDFDKYKNQSDFQFTTEQQVLMYKFDKVEEIYKQKRTEERERYINENRKIRIGKIELENIPNSFKLALLLFILIVFFGGIFYYLKKLQKKPIEKKKKKKTQ